MNMINFQNDFFLQNYWGITRQVIFGNKTFPKLLVKVAASGIAAMVGDAKGGCIVGSGNLEDLRIQDTRPSGL